jgi:hypothetical protein
MVFLLLHAEQILSYRNAECQGKERLCSLFNDPAYVRLAATRHMLPAVDVFSGMGKLQILHGSGILYMPNFQSAPV